MQSFRIGGISEGNNNCSYRVSILYTRNSEHNTLLNVVLNRLKLVLKILVLKIMFLCIF